MESQVDAAVNGQLRARIGELEKQLAAAARKDTGQERTEVALRDALAYAESIVDTVREALLVLDGDLRVKSASAAFYQTFGVSEEQTIGQFLYDLGNGQWDIPALRRLLEEMLPLEKKLRDYEVVHDFPLLGRRVMLLNAAKLVPEGDDPNRVLLAIEDITERSRIEEALLRSNEDLEHFAYVAAHDLRSPLNSALNLSQLLARRLKGKIEAEEAKMLAMSIQSMQRLGALMQDILTYSQIGSGPRMGTPLPLEESLRVALANLQHHIEETKTEVSIAPLPTVPADRIQMVLVFQNLIANAIKYRRAAESPKIHIEATQQGNHWQISVTDNGQGFEAKYAEEIFRPFKRLHGLDVHGSGIGLATSMRIIVRLGGRIWAVSKPGKGSTFFILLPGAAG